MKTRQTEAIVIGVSAGGLYALSSLLEDLPAKYPLRVIIVQHRYRDPKDLLEQILQTRCQIKIKQADEKEKIEKNTIYFAPPDYHLLIEEDLTFSLSDDALVSYSRPSIDVLFESAALVYGTMLTGILLTGANSDGTNGLLAILKNGGDTIVQSPAEAQFPYMPQSAIDKGAAKRILTLAGIKKVLQNYQANYETEL